MRHVFVVCILKESLMIKKYMACCALTFVSVIVALLMCELVIRLTGVGSMTISQGGLYINDRDVGWVCSPNSNERFFLPGAFDVRMVCNSKGLRDAEKDYVKPPGTRRILVLGDSFAWGHGVENHEMVSTVLQGLLPAAETINFGVKGYSTVQEVLRLELEGLRYDPDLALIFFCWNDLEDNFDDKELRRPVAQLADNDVLYIANRPVQNNFKSPVKLWFQANSRAYGFARYSLELLDHKLKTRRNRDIVRAQKPKAARRTEKKEASGKMVFSLPEIYAPPTPEMDRAWTAVRLLLSRARDTMVKTGGRLGVVYVATREGTDRDIFLAEMKSAGYDPDADGLDWDRPSSRLAEICAQLDIPYIDPTPAFRAHPDPEFLFSKRDAHWSPAGHRLVAETVAVAIANLGE
ncbi:MAG: hypothetical protein FJ119_02645 [Deltaproteobacteria bacterium]|nr:hypothetical protein [Deltaproteobacteria bacterium]